MSQAEDRVHRISQQYPVNIYYLYGPGTIDDIIYLMLSKKNSVIADSLDNGRLAKQYDISKASKDECLEELKERKEKGELNPILKNPKKSLVSNKSNIEEFFGDK